MREREGKREKERERERKREETNINGFPVKDLLLLAGLDSPQAEEPLEKGRIGRLKTSIKRGTEGAEVAKDALLHLLLLPLVSLPLLLQPRRLQPPAHAPHDVCPGHKVSSFPVDASDLFSFDF